MPRDAWSRGVCNSTRTRCACHAASRSTTAPLTRTVSRLPRGASTLLLSAVRGGDRDAPAAPQPRRKVGPKWQLLAGLEEHARVLLSKCITVLTGTLQLSGNRSSEDLDGIRAGKERLELLACECDFGREFVELRTLLIKPTCFQGNNLLGMLQQLSAASLQCALETIKVLRNLLLKDSTLLCQHLPVLCNTLRHGLYCCNHRV